VPGIAATRPGGLPRALGSWYRDHYCVSEIAQENCAIEAKQLALTIARIIHEKHGEDIRILDVSGPLVIADYFVIASARNARHARALAGAVDSAMKQSGRLRRNSAGLEGEGNWILLDFDDVVVHVFQSESRAFYDLESLWGDVPTVEFEPEPTPAEPTRDVSAGWEPFPDSTGTL